MKRDLRAPGDRVVERLGLVARTHIPAAFAVLHLRHVGVSSTRLLSPIDPKNLWTLFVGSVGEVDDSLRERQLREEQSERHERGPAAPFWNRIS